MSDYDSGALNYPTILYKYRSWSKLIERNPILNSTLFLSSPLAFNDPFDCRVYPNYKLLDTPEKIERYAREYLSLNSNEFAERSLNASDEIERIIATLSDPERLRKFQIRSDEIHSNSQNKYYGVLSMSARHDSSAMWAHYAENHKGYCIGYFEERMRKSGIFGAGGPVVYKNDFPEILPYAINSDAFDRSYFDETHTKNTDWSYEEEYRFTKLFYPSVPSDEDRIVNIPNDFIAEVLIGMKADSETQTTIIDIAQRKKLKIYRMVQIPHSFKLEKVPI